MRKMLKHSWLLVLAMGLVAAELPVKVELDAFTANAYIRYAVPADAPDPVLVRARYRVGNGDFKAAAVSAFRSETAMYSAVRSPNQVAKEEKAGGVTEWLAAGRERTMVWRLYPQIPVGAVTEGEVEVTLAAPAAPEKALATGRARFRFDLGGVKVLSRFADNPDIYPPIVGKGRGKAPGWYETAQGLDCVEKEDPLEPLAWRHGLSGKYALYAYVPIDGYSMVSLRLTRDGFAQRFVGIDGLEQFWKVADLTDTHIVIQDFYAFLSRLGDHARARLGYIKCVPLSEEQFAAWRRKFQPKRDKFIAAFFEPYSWSFSEYVRDNGKFSEPMAAYAEAGVDLVDVQCGRNGMRPLFPTDLGTPLLGGTRGDAHVGKDGKVTPGTYSLGTGRMGRVTDSLHASLKAARAEGLRCSINFGAGPSYAGGPLQSDFAKAHPELAVKGNPNFLCYRHEAVLDYYMKHFEKALKAGAKILTVNFKTYPHGVEEHTQSREILRRLRRLADSYAAPGERIRIMVLFPIPGSKGITADNKFRPADWIREKLVDILVCACLSVSDIYYFDPSPYVAMAKGSGVKVLVEFSGSACAPIFPDEPLRLADRFYDAGADGLYIYQADSRVVGSMSSLEAEERRWIRMLGSSQAVKAELKERAARQREYSVSLTHNFTYLFQSYRLQIWPDGMAPSRMTLTMTDAKGKEVAKSVRTAWPWVLGEGGAANHYPVGGPFQVKVVAEDPDGKRFEQEFTFPRINRSYSF